MLACAINLRLQYATSQLIEVIISLTQSQFILRTVVSGFFVTMIGALSYMRVHASYPDYNIHSIREGFKNYPQKYILADTDLDYRISLLGFSKLVRIYVLKVTEFDFLISKLISGLGLFVASFSLFLASLHRLNLLDGVFVSCCITVLFCPLVEIYHYPFFGLDSNLVL